MDISMSENSETSLNSSGISTFISPISPSAQNTANYLKLRYELLLIAEAYILTGQGEELLSLDSSNNPNRVKSVTKENYSGKICDVDVPSDVAKRKDSAAFWSNNHGSCSGTGCPNLTSASKFSKSSLFDEVNDYVNLGDPATGVFNFRTSENFSISAWVKTTDEEGSLIVSKLEENGPTDGYDTTIDSDYGIIATLGTNSGWCNVRGGSYAAIADGNWHYITVVTKRAASCNDILIYLDSAKQTESVLYGDNNEDISSPRLLVFGAGDDNDIGLNGYMNCSIDEVAMPNQESGETEWQLPTERQVFWHDGEMYIIKTEKGELVVSPLHKVYAKPSLNSRKSARSSVLKTLTTDCSLRCESFDQISIPNLIANAKYGASSGSEINDLALFNCFGEGLFFKLTSFDNIALILSNLSSDIFSLEQSSSECSPNSSRMNGWEYSSRACSLESFLVKEFFFNKENAMFASMTKSNNQSSFCNLSNILLLTSLPNLRQSLSVNTLSLVNPSSSINN
ncbi:MAG: LamG-like jellyroll fold domain-containing protein, partial [Candidatus Woesearchaeota archaeon]